MMDFTTQGIDHLGLTVGDLNATIAFFTDALGWTKIGENPTYPAVFISDGHSRLTIWAAKSDEPTAFDRHKNIGLHHFALKIRHEEDLNAAYEKVRDWPGVVVEFAPELSGKGPKRHFMIREPGGTRLEFAFDPR